MDSAMAQTEKIFQVNDLTKFIPKGNISLYIDRVGSGSRSRQDRNYNIV